MREPTQSELNRFWAFIDSEHFMGMDKVPNPLSIIVVENRLIAVWPVGVEMFKIIGNEIKREGTTWLENANISVREDFVHIDVEDIFSRVIRQLCKVLGAIAEETPLECGRTQFELRKGESRHDKTNLSSDELLVLEAMIASANRNGTIGDIKVCVSPEEVIFSDNTVGGGAIVHKGQWYMRHCGVEKDTPVTGMRAVREAGRFFGV